MKNQRQLPLLSRDASVVRASSQFARRLWDFVKPHPRGTCLTCDVLRVLWVLQAGIAIVLLVEIAIRLWSHA